MPQRLEARKHPFRWKPCPSLEFVTSVIPSHLCFIHEPNQLLELQFDTFRFLPLIFLPLFSKGFIYSGFTWISHAKDVGAGLIGKIFPMRIYDTLVKSHLQVGQMLQLWLRICFPCCFSYRQMRFELL